MAKGSRLIRQGNEELLRQHLESRGLGHDEEPVLAGLAELAGDEPVRRQLVDSYAGLWGLTRPAAAAPPPAPTRKVLRWLVGQLPRHQLGRPAQEPAMHDPSRDPTPDPSAAPSPYRGGEPAPAGAAERSALRRKIERIHQEFLRVRAAVESVIVGKRDVIERVLTALAAGGHVLLVDVPGVGKTQLCKAIAAAIDTRFGRIQFTPDLLPMDLTGANVLDPRDKELRFRPGPIFTHLLLADEINRATPKTQSALLPSASRCCTSQR